jgi:hypothetical protein
VKYLRAAIVSTLIGLGLSWVITTYAAPIDDLASGYPAGTFQADDPDYAALYEQTTARALTLSHVTEQEGRTAALYALSYQHAGGEYRETGVLVLYHDPVRLESVPVKDIDFNAIDLAVAGQAADIGSTALALSQGFVEGNPVVAGAISTPAGTAAIVALKLFGPTLANNLALEECTIVRTSIAASGWGAAAWNLAGIAGASTGVGIGMALVAGGVTAFYSETDASLRCAGIYENNSVAPSYTADFVEP